MACAIICFTGLAYKPVVDKEAVMYFVSEYTSAKMKLGMVRDIDRIIERLKAEIPGVHIVQLKLVIRVGR
jgi:hypothetical protein